MSKLVPKLRFKEFSGEWEEKSLEEIAIFTKEKIKVLDINLNTYISTENILPEFMGVSKSSKLPNILNTTKFQKNDILISNIRPYLRKVWLANFDGGASNDIIVIRAKEDNKYKFLLYIVQNNKFINYVMQGAKGVKMPRGDIALIRKYPLAIPTSKEQQKIASCLSSLDNFIEATEKKVEALKKHKRGLMQQLFPKEGEKEPTVRFNGFSGEWEEKKLKNRKDITITIGEFVIKTKQHHNAKYPVYNGGKSYTGFYDEFNNSENKIVISARGANAGYVNIVKRKYWAGNSCYSVGLTDESELNFKFLYFYIKRYENRFRDNQQTANIPSVSKKDIENFQIVYSLLSEQQKIASCFSSLDNLIEATQNKLKALKKHKKGLMQQLFVSSEMS